MKSKKNRSIRLKLIFLLSLSASIALFISSMFLLSYTYVVQKNGSLQKLSELTDIMGENLIATIEFDDKESASTLLKSLKASKNIHSAFIFKDKSSMFSSYVKKDIDSKKAEEIIYLIYKNHDMTKPFEYIDFEHIVVNRVIYFQNERIGSISILESTSGIRQIIINQLLMIFAVFIISLTIIILLAFRLQKIFTSPIFKLNNYMKEVSINHNYNFHIKHSSDDEFQTMFEGFNNMIDTINIQNKELLVAHEKSRQSAKSKSEFLANMSHEIRTPLNAIVGFVNLIKDENIGVKALDYVKIIDKSSKSLLSIIEDILDFSKIESGKLDIDKVDFNTKDEFEIIIHLFTAKAKEKNIYLSLYLDDNLPKAINTDPLRIKQVISNLISNAVKFSNEGRNIEVKINYNNNLLNVNVKDEGKGIAADKLTHIFEAFGQEDSSTTREFGGTGLGLSISSELIKLLGGELKVKSKLGVGSEFYFSIPAKIGKAIKKSTQNLDNTTFNGKNILLVEDNKANQMFMKVILTKLKAKFDIVNDGLEAVDAFKNKKYDAILMDENMPKMNGIEASKQIRIFEEKNNLIHTPIIALTANALKGDRERFLESGMDDYLSKPLDKKKLIEVLKKFLYN